MEKLGFFYIIFLTLTCLTATELSGQHTFNEGSGIVQHKPICIKGSVKTGITNNKITGKSIQTFSKFASNKINTDIRNSNMISDTSEKMYSKPCVTIVSPTRLRTYTKGDIIFIDTETAKGTTGIFRVDFYADDLLIGTEYCPPYQFNWKSTKDGKIKIVVIATDSSKTTAIDTISLFIKGRRILKDFSIVNSLTGLPIKNFKNISDGTVIDLGKTGTAVNLVVTTSSKDVGSVKFQLDNVPVNLENKPPFSVAGQCSGTLNSWSVMGSHKVTAYAFTGKDGSGEILDSITVNFKMINRSGR